MPSEVFSRFLLLANCSRNLSLRIAKEDMDLEGRLMYHCKAGPIRVEPNPLHIVASRDSFGSATRASFVCIGRYGHLDRWYHHTPLCGEKKISSASQSR